MSYLLNSHSLCAVTNALQKAGFNEPRQALHEEAAVGSNLPAACTPHSLVIYSVVSCFLLMQEAGYDEATQSLIENVMMGKNLPDPRDVRKYDLIGTLGMVDFKKLQVGCCYMSHVTLSQICQRFDPRDSRKYDLNGALVMVDFKQLQVRALLFLSQLLQ
jgi:hypothetical protein